jgi:hypothetical protein
MLAGHGRRKAEPLGGGSEALQFGDRAEDAKAHQRAIIINYQEMLLQQKGR